MALLKPWFSRFVCWSLATNQHAKKTQSSNFGAGDVFASFFHLHFESRRIVCFPTALRKIACNEAPLVLFSFLYCSFYHNIPSQACISLSSATRILSGPLYILQSLSRGKKVGRPKSGNCVVPKICCANFSNQKSFPMSIVIYVVDCMTSLDFIRRAGSIDIRQARSDNLPLFRSSLRPRKEVRHFHTALIVTESN